MVTVYLIQTLRARTVETLVRLITNDRAEAARERRQTEAITIPVGPHGGGCDGEVHYTSFFRDTAPVSQLIGQRHPPYLEEFYSCVCKGCGSVMGDPDRLAQYADLMTAHRNRTVG